MNIGTNLFGHDSSIFYIDNEKKNIFGLDTERVTRIKHDDGLITPTLNILKKIFKLKSNINLSLSTSEQHYFGDYPFKWNDLTLRKIIHNKITKKQKIRQLLKYKFYHIPLIWAYNSIPKNFKISVSSKLEPSILNICKKSINKKNGIKINNIQKYDHHLCHNASAFYFSPYSKCLSVSLDGYGDLFSSKAYLCDKNGLSYLYGSKCNLIGFSIGRLYGRITAILGLRYPGDEGKVEALGAYGNHKNKLFDFLMKNTKITNGVSITALKPLEALYNDTNKLLKLREELGDKDIAAAVQIWLERKGVEYITKIMEKERIRKFCFSGGVFANVKMNQKILEECNLRDIFIFPAMADNGCSVGAKILNMIENGENIKWLKDVEMPYWGPEYPDVKETIKNSGLPYEFIGDDWPEQCASLVAKGNIVSIFQGRMEYGPRALGNRSVLADPRNKEVKDKINNTIKRRKWYQPFCPSILETERLRLFTKSYKNKHMTCAFDVKEEYLNEIPAIMHIDGTARAQFVEKQDNLNYYNLIKAFKQETGYGVILNTSFNLHGRTIVMTPEDAIQDFIDCGLDYMFMQGYLIKRKI